MADTVGNLLGNRKTFLYTTDSGVDYNISLDESVSTAVGNTASTDGSLPVLRATASRPVQARYLLLQLKTNAFRRKYAIIGDSSNPLFSADGPSEVTINSVVWVITGRAGEQRSSVRVDDPTP